MLCVRGRVVHIINLYCRASNVSTFDLLKENIVFFSFFVRICIQCNRRLCPLFIISPSLAPRCDRMQSYRWRDLFSTVGKSQREDLFEPQAHMLYFYILRILLLFCELLFGKNTKSRWTDFEQEKHRFQRVNY